jgi:CysZ protein
MGNQFVSGALFFFQGLQLVFKPGLKRYIVVPIIMNAIVLAGIFVLLAIYLHNHIRLVLDAYPSWIILLLGGFFWVLYGLISLMVSTLIFTLLTNLMASPFYGLLAEKTAKGLVNHSLDKELVEINPSKNSLLLLIPRALAREFRKLLYFLPWLLLCLLFVIFPFAWPLLPFVWWVVLSWILAIQYIDYQADNEQVSLRRMLFLLKHSPLTVFGFGAAVSLALLIPGANLFVPAAAVAGGTALWLSIR